MRVTIFSSLFMLLGAHAFAPSRTALSSRRTTTVIGSTPAASTDSESSSPPPPADSDKPVDPNKNKPDWEVKQHLYGLDMKESSSPISVSLDADGKVVGGEALPLPKTYITCGKCKALFAISEGDLGDKGKGCRVKCSVCNSSWYQSRERLFDIPTESHDMLPARESDLNRIARNLARDIPPSFMGVYKLYVGNLDWRTSDEDLREFFEKNTKTDGGGVASVCDVSIVMGPDGRSRGFAFVSFYEESDGKAAVGCDGLECNGRELAVREPNN